MPNRMIHKQGWQTKGSLVLGALFLLGALAWAIGPKLQATTHPEVRSGEAQASPSPDAANTDATNTARGNLPITKICEFPLLAEAKTADPEVANSGTWSVTAPRVAVTYEAGIGVSSWNREGDELLIYRIGPKPGRQTIDLLDTRTDELTTIAEGEIGYGSIPKWLGPSGLVAYLDRNKDGVFHLRILDPVAQSSNLVAESDRTWVSVEFDSSVLAEDLFFLGANDALMAYSTVSRNVTAIDEMGAASLPTPGPMDWPFYQLAISPDGQHAVASGSSGSFWFSRDGTSPCRLDLASLLGPSGSLVSVQFSPSGQYLAGRGLFMLRADKSKSGPFTLIDLRTGKSLSMPITDGIEVAGFAWSPDSRAIAALVYLGMDESNVSRESLVMMDVMNEEAKSQLEGTEFHSAGIWGMSWNPNGHEIAFACPARNGSGHYFGQLCLAHVERVK